MATAFVRGVPNLEKGVAGLASGGLVLPLMTSAGYFFHEKLQPLVAQANQSNRRLTLAQPLGLDLRIVTGLATHLQELMAAQKVKGAQAVVLVVGHGTRQDPRSQGATDQLAAALTRHGVASRIEASFLDQEPTLATKASLFPRQPLVVFPFLLGGGDHARLDVPLSLGFSSEQIEEVPRGEVLAGCVRGRKVICSPALGELPGLEGLTLQWAREASQIRVGGRSEAA